VKGAKAVSPLFTVFNQGIVVESVKLAEDGSGDVIVRLYESLGERSVGMVTANFDAKGVQAVDLLERPVDGQGVAAGLDSAKLTLRPFQLVTLRFARQSR
jgi:alpha-mannosidase